MAKLNGTQKAAVLMVSLGDDTAAGVFKFLEEDEIQAISKEIALTKHVQPDIMDDVLRFKGAVNEQRALAKHLLTLIPERLADFVAQVKGRNRVAAREALNDCLERHIEGTDEALQIHAWNVFDQLAEMKRVTPTGEEVIEPEIVDEQDTRGLAPLEQPWSVVETGKFLSSVSSMPDSVMKAYRKWKMHVSMYGKDQVTKINGYNDRPLRKGSTKASGVYKSVAKARLTMKYRIIYYFNQAEKTVEPIFFWEHQGDDVPNLPDEYKAKD